MGEVEKYNEGRDNTTLEHIQRMFRSKDRELQKLAQRICHKERISYYVFRCSIITGGDDLQYSLVNSPLPRNPMFNMLYHAYIINLNKENGKTISCKQ